MEPNAFASPPLCDRAVSQFQPGDGETVTTGSAIKNQKVVKKTAPLGNKGKETRQLLMATARRLLDQVSPLSLSAAAISKEAGTSPATFYVYFDNVEDILWALCDEITEDVSHLF